MSSIIPSASQTRQSSAADARRAYGFGHTLPVVGTTIATATAPAVPPVQEVAAMEVALDDAPAVAAMEMAVDDAGPALPADPALPCSPSHDSGLSTASSDMAEDVLETSSRRRKADEQEEQVRRTPYYLHLKTFLVGKCPIL